MLDLDSDPGPEIFETSDAESIGELGVPPADPPITDTENLLELSVEGFNAAAARNRFEKHVVLDDRANFLGSVATTGLGATGISVVHWSETKEQKLARIQSELEQLQAADADERKKIDLYLNSLQAMVTSQGQKGYYYQRVTDTLKELDDGENVVWTRLGEQNATEPVKLDEGEDSHKRFPRRSNEQSALSSICTLEARLARIEATLGTPTTDPTLQQNFRIHLNDLSRKVNILSSPEETLGPVFATVSKLNKDLETLLSNKRKVDLHFGDRPHTNDRQHHTPFEAKIDRIHAKLPEIESASTILPALVARLRSLHELHASLANSVTITDDMDKTLETLLRDLKDWQTNLNEVSGAIDESDARFAANAAVVDQKLRVMEERMK